MLLDNDSRPKMNFWCHDDIINWWAQENVSETFSWAHPKLTWAHPKKKVCLCVEGSGYIVSSFAVWQTTLTSPSHTHTTDRPLQEHRCRAAERPLANCFHRVVWLCTRWPAERNTKQEEKTPAERTRREVRKTGWENPKIDWLWIDRDKGGREEERQCPLQRGQKTLTVTLTWGEKAIKSDRALHTMCRGNVAHYTNNNEINLVLKHTYIRGVQSVITVTAGQSDLVDCKEWIVTVL